jgi:hypothetical protein
MDNFFPIFRGLKTLTLYLGQETESKDVLKSYRREVQKRLQLGRRQRYLKHAHEGIRLFTLDLVPMKCLRTLASQILSLSMDPADHAKEILRRSPLIELFRRIVGLHNEVCLHGRESVCEARIGHNRRRPEQIEQ